MGLRQLTSTTRRRRASRGCGAFAVSLLATIAIGGTGRTDPSSALGIDAISPRAAGWAATASTGKSPSPRAQRHSQAKPRPTEQAAPAREEELPEVRNAAGEPLRVSGAECERNLAIAAKHGLRLPDGWRMHCVGPGLDWEGATHWGVTCPYEDCPEGEGPYVSISNPSYYVVAHELCHANFGNDELMADECAAKHGASLASSPYN